jgi:hypothetical protein
VQSFDHGVRSTSPATFRGGRRTFVPVPKTTTAREPCSFAERTGLRLCYQQRVDSRTPRISRT